MASVARKVRAPRVSGKAVLGALRRAGWVKVTREGAHVKMMCPACGRRIIVVDTRDDLPVGTLCGIVRDAGLTKADLVEML
jgi:predicted RNA binding protein YcfA (HicA-like mRNA interferase family)